MIYDPTPLMLRSAFLARVDNIQSNLKYSASPILEDLFCTCGEPMKITGDQGMSPIGCLRCGSHICFDDPQEFDAIFQLLRRYWLEQGRRDYAGLV